MSKHGYKAFFNGKQADVYAESIYQAKRQAIAIFKPAKSKQHMVSVILCEKDGVTVSHSTAEFG